MFWLVVGCACADGGNQGRYASGVSKELAEWRKETLKELKYNLFFSIPERKTEPVEGRMTVSFCLEKPQEVVLDFRNDSGLLHGIWVNGKETAIVFRNEHVILPPTDMKAGENQVQICFTAGDQSLNRNDEFLYTLLVPDRARTVFPCFDQPDLKAKFTLSLMIPDRWKAVSNTYISEGEAGADGRRIVHFAETEPLSTYLFSFVAGVLQCKEYREGEHRVCVYYRETDPKKVAQLDAICGQVVYSLDWMENFTGVPYPFAKYDFIILPGFQYGGMEHTGATLYNDTRMFLNEHPTPDEELGRAQLIAHETAHMWFGDYVTMEWFDDVWTKEVFANYFAACITEPMFPKMNHALEWLRGYTESSLSEDRTLGTTSIKQELDNLNRAGLIYGQIIYNKAPVMMKKLVDLMGEDAFREGIREYVRTFAYGNATWEKLVHILDRYTDADLQAFSRVWVHEKGMPCFSFSMQDGELEVRQRDPYRRGLVWPQAFRVQLHGERDTAVEVRIADTLTRIAVPFKVTRMVPNTDGRGYGFFMPDEHSLEWILQHWHTLPDETGRQASVMLLHENYLARRIPAEEWMGALTNGLRTEHNPQIAATLAGYVGEPLQCLENERQRAAVEADLFRLAQTHPIRSCRIRLLRMLMTCHVSGELGEQLYDIWKKREHVLLGENDYTTLAYELSVRYPGRSAEILKTQRARITNPDRLRQFDFIARAVAADTLQRDSLFRSFLQAENRRIEPWTATALRYLNHACRDGYAVKYIYPALDALQDVQRTGDIFFPKNWASALLSQHRCDGAYREVKRFLAEHPDYPVLLKNKILQSADPLYRKYEPGLIK